MDPIVALARAYAFWLELGHTQAEARAHIMGGGLQANAQQADAAEALYQQGMTIAANIRDLPVTSPLNLAFPGADPPQTNVGVRVLLTIKRADGETVFRTIYVDVPWYGNYTDIVLAVQDFIEQSRPKSGKEQSYEFQLHGPTFWAPA